MPNTKVHKTTFDFSSTRWCSEKIIIITADIVELLLAFNTEIGEPKNVTVALSPLLAKELFMFDPVDLNTTLLGVPIVFKVDWLLSTDNQANALITISQL